MRRIVDLYCLLAGAVDATTGILLVSAPTLTLRLMGIGEAPAETVFLRWIGVFVGSVGLFYLLPFVLRGAPGKTARQRVVLELTTLARLAVGVFVTTSAIAGALAAAWLTVAATDLGLALIQVGLLLRKDDRR